MTTGTENPQPRSPAPPTVAAAGARGTPRWLPLALAVAVVLVIAAVGGLASAFRPPPPPPRLRGAFGPDAWSIGRLRQFRRDCEDGSAGPTPQGTPSDDAGLDRYCRCVTDGLAAAFPSYRLGRHAYFLSAAAADADARQAAEIARACVAAGR